MLLLLACTSMPGRTFPTANDSPVAVSDDSEVSDDTSTADDSRQTDDSSATDDSESPWERPERPDTSSPGEDESWRYGGGVGYPDSIDPEWPIVTRVETLAELSAALEAAPEGWIVWLEGHATVDLTGTSLCIPQGVTLASDRGVKGAPGALITTQETVKAPILAACGDDIRVTGLRILGAEPSECPGTWPDSCSGEDRTGGVNCRDCEPASIGFQARAFDRIEVDNNELAGWSYAATWFTDSVDNKVHHNHIHHTQRQGLGYGVVLTRGGDDDVTVEINGNRFDYNRHAVAGSGEPGQDYEAWDNLVLPHAIGHIFDMHGENENTDNGSELAGGDIRVHGNTILPTDQYALVVRGRPDHGSWLYDNCLARTSASSAALQRFFTGNFYVDTAPDGSTAANAYSQSAGNCETERICISEGAIGPWEYGGALTGNFLVGDLDGDGRDDLFRATGSEWQWSSAASTGWTKRGSSSYTAVSLADVDGDGADDVISTAGSGWQYASGGTGKWIPLNTLTDAQDEIVWRDFDGDGVDDAFRTTGSEWQWSRSGTAPWSTRNVSTVALSNLGFGDFDADGATDAFRSSGGVWSISKKASGSWTDWNTSTATLSSLDFADVDGDGTTDIVALGGTTWFTSYAGQSNWSFLRISSEGSARFGDATGDGRDDALLPGCL